MRKLLALLVLISSMVAAQEYPLRVLTEDLPPLQYLRDGNAEGVVVNKVAELLEQSELQAEIEVLPWSRAYQTTLNRPNTLLFSMMRIEAREALFVWLTPIAELNVWLYAVKPELSPEQLDWDQLDKYYGAMLQDGAADHHFSAMGLDYLSTNDDAAMARMLATGRLDYVIHTDLTFDSDIEPFLAAQQILYKTKIPELSRILWLAANIQTDPVIIEALKSAIQSQEE